MTCVTGESECAQNLGSQKEFYKHILDEYIPYDYVTEDSCKYARNSPEQIREIHSTRAVWSDLPKAGPFCFLFNPAVLSGLTLTVPVDPCHLRWERSSLDVQKSLSLDKVVGCLEEEDNTLPEDEYITRWVPIDFGYVEPTLTDQQFLNDLSVTSSPWRTVEKSVLTMLMPIRPYPKKRRETGQWSEDPVTQEPILYREGKPTGQKYISMMTRFQGIARKHVFLRYK